MSNRRPIAIRTGLSESARGATTRPIAMTTARPPVKPSDGTRPALPPTSTSTPTPVMSRPQAAPLQVARNQARSLARPAVLDPTPNRRRP